MITTNDWKEFCNYRKQKETDLLNSDAFKDIDRKIEDIRKSQIVTRKFLWFTWTSTVSLEEMLHNLRFELELLKEKQSLFDKHIPPYTFEACLNWLVSKESSNQ